VGEATLADGVVDRPRGHGQPERPVAGGGPLGQDQDVGPDRPVVAGEPAAGAAESGHDLVGDDQHPVAAADLGDRRPVVVGRDGRPQAGPGDRLGHERGHRARRRGEDLLLEGLGVAGPAAGRVGVAERAAVLVRGQGVAGQAEPGQVRSAQRPAAADVKGPSGVAVVAAVAADHAPAVLAPGQVVGAGHLQGRLDRFAAARHRVDPRAVHGQQRGQLVGVGLQLLGGEHGPVGVGDPPHLVGDGRRHPGVAVADPDDDRPPGPVQVPAPLGVPQLAALGPSYRRQPGPPGEDVAHPFTYTPSGSSSSRISRSSVPVGSGVTWRSSATRRSQPVAARASWTVTPGWTASRTISPVSGSKP
jgi:hypothetical protein